MALPMLPRTSWQPGGDHSGWTWGLEGRKSTPVGLWCPGTALTWPTLSYGGTKGARRLLLSFPTLQPTPWSSCGREGLGKSPMGPTGGPTTSSHSSYHWQDEATCGCSQPGGVCTGRAECSLPWHRGTQGLTLPRCVFSSPQTNRGAFLTLLVKSRGTSTRCGMEPVPRRGTCRDTQRDSASHWSHSPLPQLKRPPWGSGFLRSPAGKTSPRMETFPKVSAACLGKGCLDITLPQKARLRVQKCWKTALLWPCWAPRGAEVAAGAGCPQAQSRMAHFCNRSQWQLGTILWRNQSAKPSAGDGCPSPMSLRESCHVTTALSHRRAAGSSPRGCSAFSERGFPGAASRHRKRLTRRGFRTECGFAAFTVERGMRAASSGGRAGSWRASHQWLCSPRHGYGLGQLCQGR